MTIHLRKIEIQPTNRCNYRCFYCYGKGDRARGASLGKEDLSFLVREISRKNIGHVVISGMRGEPLLNPYVPEFISAIKQGAGEGQYLGLHTNGTLIDRKLIEILTKENQAGDYINIHVSALPSDNEVFLRTHGAAPELGEQALKMAGILINKKAQVGSGIKIRLNCLLCAENYNEISDLGKFLRALEDMGFDEIRISLPIDPLGQKNFQGLFLSQGQVDEIAQFQDEWTKKKVPFVFDRMTRFHRGNSFLRCFVKDSAFVISPDGRVAPCCYTSFPSFPYRGERIGGREGIDYLFGQIRETPFIPREVCPSCSYADFAFNNFFPNS